MKLKVHEAVQDDVNKGIVRIDTSFMTELDIRPGDFVEIEGERKTVAIADRAYPGDIGLNLVRMDGIVRRNAKSGIGEMVKIRKIEVKEAKKVVIAPSQKGIIIRARPETFRQGLLGRVVVKGDIVSLGGTKRRKSTMSHSPFFNEIFDMLDESMMGFGFGDIKFIVADVAPKQAVAITGLTEIVINPEAIEVDEEKILEVTYEDIGGLSEEIKKIREMIELPLKHPEVFETLGIEPPKGVLLHGPPGTGKTLLAKAVANETNANFTVINGPEIMSKFYGESEANLRKIFDEAEKNSPSIIFIDEIDAIAPKREELKGEVERRVVAQLLSLMDGLKSRGKIVVIAATNIPNLIDPALRRPGRFDRELEIGVPGKEGRLNILKIHTRYMPLKPNLEVAEIKDELNMSIDEVDNFLKAKNIEKEELENLQKKKSTFTNIGIKLSKIETDKELVKSLNTFDEDSQKYINTLMKNSMLDKLAEITYGFVGADLSSLAKEAAMVRLRKVMPELKIKDEGTIPEEFLAKLIITQDDFKEALKVVRPSAMREVFIEAPTVKWDDIGGLNRIKQDLQEAVEWPLLKPEVFSRMGVKPPKGILLYGAPGTGKTLLAKAVANESNANFILVKGPEVLSKWVGESEKAVREVFKKARQTSPTIIFFDEIDSVAPARSVSSDSNVSQRVVNQILTEMDGLEELNDVVVIAATNRPDIIDTALLRPGRFDRIILVEAPDKETREKIFKLHTKNMPIAKDVDLKQLVGKLEGYSGADIEAVCREAAIMALRDNIDSKKVNLKYFNQAIEKVPPSITKDISEAYKGLQKQFSSAKAKQMESEKPNYYG